MAECKFCHKPIRWAKEGERSVPYNTDGTPHRCKKETAVNGPAAADPPIIGRLESFTNGSATFTVQDGSQKTYAITAGMAQEWKGAGFLQPADNHPDIWMEFTKDKAAFIQPGSWRVVQKPAWAAYLSDPTNQKITQAPQRQRDPATAAKMQSAGFGQDAPGQQQGGGACTSPSTPPKEDGIARIVRETKERNEADAKPSEKDTWGQEREEFCNLLTSTGREGMPDLLQHLVEKTDFFIAPSSTKYHDARDGGLLHHSLTTYHNLVALSRTFAGDYPADSLIVIGLLHDVCKANFYKTSFRNVKHEERPIGDQWVKEPYIDIEDQFPLGHGEKSTILLLRYISLTDTEIMAIRWHMMAYDDIRCSYAGNLAITNACSKFPIIVLMHIADLSASFLEMRPAEKAVS